MTVTDLIREWAKERHLEKADPKTQLVKLVEEIGELADGLLKENKEKIIDSIGDAYVVLTILAMQLGLTIEECISSAYNEIKDRRGKVIDGVFVKESDMKR
jgi:NTP pyrophosphatase (non-canonical NTP hydrolase)